MIQQVLNITLGGRPAIRLGWSEYLKLAAFCSPGTVSRALMTLHYQFPNGGLQWYLWRDRDSLTLGHPTISPRHFGQTTAKSFLPQLPMCTIYSRGETTSKDYPYQNVYLLIVHLHLQFCIQNLWIAVWIMLYCNPTIFDINEIYISIRCARYINLYKWWTHARDGCSGNGHQGNILTEANYI